MRSRSLLRMRRGVGRNRAEKWEVLLESWGGKERYGFERVRRALRRERTTTRHCGETTWAKEFSVCAERCFLGGIYILDGRRQHILDFSERAAFLHSILRRMSDHFKHPRHQKNQIYLPISLFSGESTLLARSFRFLLAT
jgi:hypothetical protein